MCKTDDKTKLQDKVYPKQHKIIDFFVVDDFSNSKRHVPEILENAGFERVGSEFDFECREIYEAHIAGFSVRVVRTIEAMRSEFTIRSGHMNILFILSDDSLIYEPKMALNNLLNTACEEIKKRRIIEIRLLSNCR